MERFVETIKQHPGAVQVTHAVKVDVPGKHFPTLQTAEQKQMYSGTAVEYSERHQFDRHLKAWEEHRAEAARADHSAAPQLEVRLPTPNQRRSGAALQEQVRRRPAG